MEMTTEQRISSNTPCDCERIGVLEIKDVHPQGRSEQPQRLF